MFLVDTFLYIIYSLLVFLIGYSEMIFDFFGYNVITLGASKDPHWILDLIITLWLMGAIFISIAIMIKRSARLIIRTVKAIKLKLSLG